MSLGVFILDQSLCEHDGCVVHKGNFDPFILILDNEDMAQFTYISLKVLPQLSPKEDYHLITGPSHV